VKRVVGRLEGVDDREAQLPRRLVHAHGEAAREERVLGREIVERTELV